MGKDFCDHHALARHLFEEAGDAVGFDLRRLCHQGDESELALTYHAQPAILNDNHAADGTAVRHETPRRDSADLAAPLLSACGAGGEGDGGDVRIRGIWRANLRITPFVYRKTLFPGFRPRSSAWLWAGFDR